MPRPHIIFFVYEFFRCAHIRLFWNQPRTKATVCSDFLWCAFWNILLRLCLYFFIIFSFISISPKISYYSIEERTPKTIQNSNHLNLCSWLCGPCFVLFVVFIEFGFFLHIRAVLITIFRSFWKLQSNILTVAHIYSAGLRYLLTLSKSIFVTIIFTTFHDITKWINRAITGLFLFRFRGVKLHKLSDCVHAYACARVHTEFSAIKLFK